MDDWRGVRFGMDYVSVERVLLEQDPSLVCEAHLSNDGSSLSITGDGWKAARARIRGARARAAAAARRDRRGGVREAARGRVHRGAKIRDDAAVLPSDP